LPLSVRLADDLHATHRRLYGYADVARPIEVINIRLLATGRTGRPRLPRPAPPPQRGAASHRIRWDGRWLSAHLHFREQLAVFSSVRGPALLAEFSGTTFVPPGWGASVHRTGHVVLTHAR
jgi:N-methylhydantoinase A